MSQPAGSSSLEGQSPPADPRPPAYGSPYGLAPGAPPSPYGQGEQPYGHQTPQGHGPYDGRWGYGPPGNPGPRTQPMGDDTTWAMFVYLGTLLLGFLAPLIIYFVKRNESGFVRFHAAQALNYVITQFCILVLTLVPAIVLAVALDTPAAILAWLPVVLFEVISQYVFLILGTIRSNRGEWYRIPTWTCWRMIR